MRKQTDLAKVKLTALALLSTEINETPYSPMIVKHPFTDTGVSAIPDGKGGVEMIDLTEDDAQLRWRQSMARQIDIVNCITKESKKNTDRPQYYVTNNHPAIIPREKFDRVQMELARRGSLKKKRQTGVKTELGKYSSKYALTELLICGNCGTAYRRSVWSKNGKKNLILVVRFTGIYG